jgi:hypothetical protein
LARNWLFSQDDKKASEIRMSLLGRMTRDQIAEGQRRASAFRARTESSTTWRAPSYNLNPPQHQLQSFFIKEDEFLISNEHVVSDAAQVRLVNASVVSREA